MGRQECEEGGLAALGRQVVFFGIVGEEGSRLTAARELTVFV